MAKLVLCVLDKPVYAMDWFDLFHEVSKAAYILLAVSIHTCQSEG